jgi:hypothetical protein
MKMTNTDFERWLKQGRGKAAAFIQNGEQSRYQDALLHACTHNLCYDPESEETRGYYLANLIQMTADPRPFREGVIAVLRSPIDELQPNDILQLFALARHWAADGDEGVRHLLYDFFSREGFVRAEVGCGAYLVKIDGLDALLFVVPFLERVEERFRLWQFNHLVSTLEERDGKEAAALELADAASNNPEMARLRELAHSEDARLAKEGEDLAATWDKPNAPYSEIRRQMRDGTPNMVSLLIWAKRATEDELKDLAADMFSETDQRRIWNYLLVFSCRRFPGSIAPLIEVARTANPFLSHAATRVLANIDEPEVRTLGRDLLATSQRCCLGVRLLARRSEPGDYGLIEEALQRDMHGSAYHALCLAVLDFVKANAVDEAFDSLELLFENTFSSDCRRRAVEYLVALNHLPDWMRDECRHDAEARTRELARGATEQQ